MNKTYCIIGTSAAGIAAAQKLRQLDLVATIICISDEVEMPYNKCMLADYASGTKDVSAVYTLSVEQAAKKNITFLLGKKVIAINAGAQTITLSDNQTITYDALLLAVGTSPIIPAIKGIDADGVFTFHRLSDINKIMQYIKQQSVQTVTVIGSGLSGLECADALMAQGIQVTIVERNKNVLSSLVNEPGSCLIEEHFKAARGVLYSACTVQEIIHTDGRAQAVRLSDGTIIKSNMVIIAVGIAPNVALAKPLSLAMHESVGIAVNEYMQTSQENIFAAGDIVVVKDQITGALVASRTWPDAMLQGITAAHAMAVQPKAYPGLATVISSSFFGIKFARFGIINSLSADDEVIGFQSKDFYHQFIVQDSQLKGFLLVGNTAHVGKFRMAVLTKSAVNRESLSALSMPIDT